jgi:ABC-type transporter Mla MlaB component
MFRTTVVCSGLSEGEASEAIADMLSEFAMRPWQQDVKCEWRQGMLRLSAHNDVDSTGLALLDEFQDAVVACINFQEKIRFEIESVVQV